MTARGRVWLFGGLGLLLWLALAWVLSAALGLRGGDWWIIWGGLGLLGLIAAGVLVWYFLQELPPEEEEELQPRGGDDIDLAVNTARQRLRTARYAEQTHLGRLPILLCLGPVGSAKTTTIVRSGLDPDLLAGETLRGDAVVATRSVNLWYSSGVVFLEAGGRLTEDPAEWIRLVRHLQPSRLAAVFSAGVQAPRVAVVCFSTEELLKPGGSEAVLAAARDLRARLLEVSQRLGIRLPVYVVFTKADQIPRFDDWARNFSATEAREVLGTTLPWDAGPAGTYADRTATRVGSSLQQMADSLAALRLQLLPRETQPDIVAGAYEFPREFRKLVPLATQFLVDLCKPSQLEVSPILRGFYFTGVRAVTVEEGARAAEPQPAAPRGKATDVFQPALFAAAPASPAPAQPVSRRVPEWMFLGRLFRDVILRDRVALAATAGGTRVNLLRRVLVGAAGVVALIFALGFIVSFATNRRLQHQIMTATNALLRAPVPPPGDLASVESLARMDSVRALTGRLGGWERDGAPFRLRWGLYTGATMYPDLRRVYFKEFDSLLFTPTDDALVKKLLNLPPVPDANSDYPGSLNLLKAHLITTSYPARSTPEFLAPVLTAVWEEGHDVTPDRLQLARQQFEFYAGELPRDNPLVLEPDSVAMQRARAFLRQFKSSRRIYQLMLPEAAKAPGARQFSFAQAFPSQPTLVIAPHVVPAEFTRQGWAFMRKALKDTDRFFTGEEWVLGEQGLSDPEKRQIVAEIETLYRADYAGHWRALLAQASIAPFTGLADAAKKLVALGSNPSPLLQLINTVSLNVAVDSQLARMFQPALVVSPADSTKLIGEKTQPYISAVLSLGTALEDVARTPSAQAEGPVQEARNQAAAAKLAARNIQTAFVPDSTRINENVMRLLLEGLNRIDPMLGNLGVAGLNQAGAEFCGRINRVLAKAPFLPGQAPAPLTEINEIFQRPSGAIWNFYNGTLTKYLNIQGDGFGPALSSGVRVNPSFVQFMSKASQFSRALYPEGQPGPRITITFRPTLSDQVPEMRLIVSGQTRSFTRFSAGEQPILWVGDEAREASVEARIGGTFLPKRGTSGTWAIFDLFGQARKWRASGSRFTAEWSFAAGGHEVTLPFELSLPASRPIFDPDWLRGLSSCVSRIASP
jgi:type VI secretion system protein ImpL